MHGRHVRRTHASAEAPSVNILKNVSATVVALALLAAAPAARADVVFDGRWHTRGLNAWDARVSDEPGNRNKLAFVRSPRRRRSGYSADLKVGGNAASERINFVESPLFADAEGRDNWYAWSTYLPADANLPGGRLSSQVDIASFFSKFNADYCDPSRGGAASTLFLYSDGRSRRSNAWRFKITGGNGSCTVRTHDIRRLGVPKEKWIDFLCHFRWSAVAGTALSKCYWRVQPRKRWRLGFTDTGPNSVRSPTTPGSLSIHYGLYKAEARPYVHIVQGGLVVADTKAEAVRAAFTAAGTGRSASPRVLMIAGAAIGVVAVLLVGRALLVRSRHPLRPGDRLAGRS
jgi:hypothetical protein